MEAQSTINYFQFKHIDSNRPIDPGHVKKLVAAITKKNLLHLHPIVVNNNMEVIDGQHRLEAAKQLKIYIPYVIDGEINKLDIATINSNAKNWSILDYINYWSKEEAPGFDKLCEYMITYPRIPPSTILFLLSPSEVRDHNGLREGRIDVSNWDKAVDVANILEEINKEYLFKFAYEANFIRAITRCIKTPGYDHEIMKRKIELQPRTLQKCANVKQYLEMLEEIYNHKSSLNRLTFR